jgi:hypothetical protein
MGCNMTKMPIKIRDAEENDVNFIFNSWLNSFRNGYLPHQVDNTIYFAEQHKIIERLLRSAHVKIAINELEPDNILGYICYETIENIFTLHYAYTKHTFRKMGVFSQLVSSVRENNENRAMCSHNNFQFSKLINKLNMVYHPYLIINHK